MLLKIFTVAFMAGLCKFCPVIFVVSTILGNNIIAVLGDRN